MRLWTAGRGSQPGLDRTWVREKRGLTPRGGGGWAEGPAELGQSEVEVAGS